MSQKCTIIKCSLALKATVLLYSRITGSTSLPRVFSKIIAVSLVDG